MNIMFYSKGDAAVYLNRLLNIDLVASAEVQSISSSDQNFLYQAQFALKLNTLTGEGS